MGCDIHMLVQARLNGSRSWAVVNPPEDWYEDGYDRKYKLWYSDRCYSAFAILANVRNGYGFAGIATGDAFVPVLQELRGLPDGIADDGWLGDHSFNWLTLQELVEYPHWDKTRTVTGVVCSKNYVPVTGDNNGPKEYCGSVGGGGTRVLSESEFITEGCPRDDRTYVRMSWTESYAFSARRLYTRLIPGLRKWADERGIAYDDVRLVFGFDS